MMFEDTYKHKGLRKKLVDELVNKGIKDKRVLKSIGNVPRHLFMDSGFIKFSYKDQAFPIAAGQTISQPYTVAFQTELLEVKPRHKVLEIGTGSGYQAAVLLEMGAKVYTIERQKELYMQAQSLLPKIGYEPMFFYGDGYVGKPTYGPYDRIIITAGAEEIPEELIKQLKVGGKMVIPLGNTSNQQMIVCEKVSENQVKQTRHGNFIFVPLLHGVEK